MAWLDIMEGDGTKGEGCFLRARAGEDLGDWNRSDRLSRWWRYCTGGMGGIVLAMGGICSIWVWLDARCGLMWVVYVPSMGDPSLATSCVMLSIVLIRLSICAMLVTWASRASWASRRSLACCATS